MGNRDIFRGAVISLAVVGGLEVGAPIANVRHLRVCKSTADVYGNGVEISFTGVEDISVAISLADLQRMEAMTSLAGSWTGWAFQIMQQQSG